MMVFARFGRIIWRMIRDPESRTLVSLVAGLLAFGTVYYRVVEGWGWLDSLYFCVITLATVGYGDFSPKTALGKIFTMVYIIAGLGLLAGFISLVAEHQQRDMEARRAQRNAQNTPPPPES